MSSSEAFNCSTRVSSSAINKQGGSDYCKVLPIGTRQGNMYLYSCCGATCSSAPARRSSPAYLGLRCDIGRRRHPALIGAWRSASGPSRVVPPRLPPEALRRHTPGACQIYVGISLRHPAADNNCQLSCINFCICLSNQCICLSKIFVLRIHTKFQVPCFPY
jgi:hypothetical protein